MPPKKTKKVLKPEKQDLTRGGQPRYLSSPDELQKAINEYFNNCPDKKYYITKTGDRIELPVPTISGLAYYLGFEDRQSMYDYEKIEGYSCILKKARLLIERKYEQMLENSSPAGAIFALKNMGWKDAQQREITGKDGEPLVKKVYITDDDKDAVNKHIEDIINGD